MSELAALFVLLTVVGFVLLRLPPVEGINHTIAFKRRRRVNWMALGMTYACMYMGRYNLTVSKRAFGALRDHLGNPLMGNDHFGIIFAAGTAAYGFSFLINGPLTDRYGGRVAILVGTAGSLLANVIMGLATWSVVSDGPCSSFIVSNFTAVYSVLYAFNMYFQSFGAVAIVKANAPWFHVRERGVFGATFGILISLGIYFAFDWGYAIVTHLDLQWAFLIPAIVMAVCLVANLAIVKNSPADAGYPALDTGDASAGDTSPQLGAIEVFKRMARNPVIVTIAIVEFCSGFLRQDIMQWYRTFARQTNGTLGLMDSVVYQHYGLALCCASILGGLFAGIVSDRVFQSRRGPVATILFAGLFGGSVILGLAVPLGSVVVGPLIILMAMFVIGAHGMLSGTASMDFGGTRNAGIAVGIIDGCVYLGAFVMSLTNAALLPAEQLDDAGNLVGPATEPVSWIPWPVTMALVSIIGLLFASRLWNARPGD